MIKESINEVRDAWKSASNALYRSGRDHEVENFRIDFVKQHADRLMRKHDLAQIQEYLKEIKMQLPEEHYIMREVKAGRLELPPGRTGMLKLRVKRAFEAHLTNVTHEEGK